ncbi:MAG TPA: MarR family transcriptional regulator [Gemmataceae bacterium]|nr:MarR family transcriptional regulator [Gemmataceae bacterium]
MIDAQELARLVAEFGKIYTRRVWSEIGKAGTTPARARLLAALQCQGSRMMSELGAELGVTPRSVTKLVDSLEAEGLVARHAHPSDRRATLVSLTDKGVLVGKESALADHAAAAWLYEQLGPADRQHLARILRKLLATLGMVLFCASRVL